MKREYMSQKSWLDSFTLPINVDENKLWEIYPKEHGQVKIYGKLIDVPRFQKAYGHDYTFSGLNHKADPIPNTLHYLLDYVNSLHYGTFNQMLINWYENGHHYIGLHSDDETQLVPNSPILSISIGATRRFRIKSKLTSYNKNVMLDNKSVVVMGGHFQKEFQHTVPKISGPSGLNVGRRINITFRQFK